MVTGSAAANPQDVVVQLGERGGWECRACTTRRRGPLRSFLRRNGNEASTGVGFRSLTREPFKMTEGREWWEPAMLVSGRSNDAPRTGINKVDVAAIRTAVSAGSLPRTSPILSSTPQ